MSKAEGAKPERGEQDMHPIYITEWAQNKTAIIEGFTVVAGPARNELLKDAEGFTVAVRPIN